jgi:hypothetical protein
MPTVESCRRGVDPSCILTDTDLTAAAQRGFVDLAFKDIGKKFAKDGCFIDV